MRAIVISDLLSVLLFLASGVAFWAWWITIDVGSTAMEWLVGGVYLGAGATLLAASILCAIQSSLLKILRELKNGKK